MGRAWPRVHWMCLNGAYFLLHMVLSVLMDAILDLSYRLVLKRIALGASSLPAVPEVEMEP